MSLYVQYDAAGNVIYVMRQPQDPPLTMVADDDAGALAWLAAQVQPRAPTPQQMIATALAPGLAVTSTGTSALSGTYGITQQDQFALMGLQLAIASGLTPPMPYIDSTGTSRRLTNAQVTALATGALAFIAAVNQWADSGGQGATPSNAVTMP